MDNRRDISTWVLLPRDMAVFLNRAAIAWRAYWLAHSSGRAFYRP